MWNCLSNRVLDTNDANYDQIMCDFLYVTGCVFFFGWPIGEQQSPKSLSCKLSNLIVYSRAEFRSNESLLALCVQVAIAALEKEIRSSF